MSPHPPPFTPDAHRTSPTRRDFCRTLAHLLVTSSVPLLASCGESTPTLTDTDTLAKNFPVKMPGAAATVKHLYQGSRFCLVHILQIHGSRSMYKREDEHIDKVQNDIYTILNYLIQHHSLREVYEEGVTVEEYQHTPPRIVDPSHPLDVTPPEGYQWDALLRLYHKGRLRTLPAEITESYGKGQIEVEESIFFPMTGPAQEEREDTLLAIISQSHAPLAVTVFGAAHDWSDNIKRWNRTFPDQKFSFIEIVPSHIELYNQRRKDKIVIK